MLHSYSNTSTDTVPSQGTFEINLPSIAATTFTYSTAVTMVGIKTGDSVVCSMQSAMDTTAQIFTGVVPTDDTLTLYFVGIGSVVAARDHTVAYTVAR